MKPANTVSVPWTLALRQACDAVWRDPTPSPYGWDSTDLKSRAREFATGAVVGTELAPWQAEYFTCLYQRLDCGGKERETHKALKRAWDAAWEAAKGQQA